MNTQSIRETDWDAIVVGTGIGGGTIGFALAKAGLRVLFLEKGRSHLQRDDEGIYGRYAEEFFHRDQPKEAAVNRRILSKAGRYCDLVTEATNLSSYQFAPFIGEGTGGSSALYGMVMERLFPEDFAPGQYFADAPGASIPSTWPISYDELKPYYSMAERLYRVRGELDPLRSPFLDALWDPPAPSEPSLELLNFFRSKGLHPYLMPMACEYVPGCQECLGYLCPKDCKNDSSRVCVAPALAQHSAALLDRCEVTRLEVADRLVTGVRCRVVDEEFVLRAKVVILAAGALHTPCILLRSRTPNCPDGLANRSRLVGKNLMRHYFDLYCVKTKTALQQGVLIKQIALNDLYRADDQKLGTVQAVGSLASAAALVSELHNEVRRKGNPALARIIKLARPIMTYAVDRFICRRLILTAIMEDVPYEENQIRPSPSGTGIEIRYRIRPYDRRRIKLFRDKVKSLLRPYPYTIVKNAENTERLAHACGTCRFGDDPATSVLDRNNRAHDLDNLYVVDTSFFPTGSGINPSLTVAANALRVADEIVRAS